MKIGLIGNGRQSKRIQKILKKKKINFLIYKPENINYFDRDDLKKLDYCDAIFILTPNNKHYYYINKFHKKKYIFCEKPPVNNKKELKKLSQIKQGKIYFNYNFRFSKFSELLKNRKIFSLGNLIFGNLTSTHGLAFKKEFINNWRSNKKKCPKGIFEIVSTHWIDLINYHFTIKSIKLVLKNISRVGNSYDTAFTQIICGNGAILNIFNTYSSPYTKKNFFIFKNGIIEENENNIEVRGPALNLDKKGFFKKPKKILSIKNNEEKDFDNSLEKSINYFLKHVKLKKTFPKKLFRSSIETTKFCL